MAAPDKNCPRCEGTGRPATPDSRVANVQCSCIVYGVHQLDGIWKGKRAFLIGGGPSLKTFDWSLLEGEFTVAINRAAVRVPTPERSIFFTEDYRHIDEYRDEMKDWPGIKLFHCGDARQHDHEDVYTYVCNHDKWPVTEQRNWKKSLKDGLIHAYSSALSAMNLIDILEPDIVGLLGLDMDTPGEQVENFHDDYPKDWHPPASQLVRFQEEIERIAPFHMRSTVINLSEESQLRAWQKLRTETFLRTTASLQRDVA